MNDKYTYFKQLITALGYTNNSDNRNLYAKTYKDHRYTVVVDFEKNKIEYPKPITLGDRTTSHFEASENFVVLECVDRLLEKGYKPEYITLEKKWGVGHKDKGKADVFITHPDEKAFLIIECKTWGGEFDGEMDKTLSNGGQLFGYYQQDRKTEFLCLYTSIFRNNQIRYTNRIIEVKEEWKEGGNKAEVFKIWKDNFGQTFKYNGIFDDDATPYNVVLKNLKRKNLVDLQQGDSGYIYNQFAEILRHNVVSDKPNAFNKMFNLILAKIVDEEKGEDEILDFQWLDSDDDIELQKRLNDLYKHGMLEYLKKEVTDLADQELDKILKNNQDKVLDNLIRKRVTELRLHKNNEFAFKEVFNEKSFKDNAVIVRDTVKLLQSYQLRYSHKQQFLSNFFELLLSNTLKQEAGQFFTPVPVAKFIISSIPLKEIAEQKIAEKKGEFLPYVMDFAAGSGHFLTETMDELQQIVEKLEPKNVSQTIKSNIKQYKEYPYQWAEKYIYGIEKDYRLAKIAKVSCFLNGDGLANIIHADGLDSFNSDDYKGAVLLSSDKMIKENPNFDVLVANPPYSVQSFIKTLPKGKESFDIFPSFTEQSKEIECAFIERAKQIIKENGFVGIILPSSILGNTGIYSQAREIIFKYFKIVAIVEFGSATFMATGTNTITLFLKRRKDTEHQEIQNNIERFFKAGFVAKEINGVENPFETYINDVFQIDLSDYQSFVNRKPNEAIKKTELFQDYEKWYNGLTDTKNLKEKIEKIENNVVSLRKTKTKDSKEAEKLTIKIQEVETQLEAVKSDLIRLFYEKSFGIEQDKMLYYFLSAPQEVVIIKTNPSSDNDKEKQFLGYEFSTRRGHEGLKMHTDIEGNLTTKLYNETNRKDETKISSYIYKAMCGEKITNIHSSLSDNITTTPLSMLMNFDRVSFEKEVSLAVKKKVETRIETKWRLEKLDNVIELVSGQSPESSFYNIEKSGLPFYQGKIDFGEDYLQDPRMWTMQTTKKSIKGDILMSVRAPVGPVNLNLFDEICIGRGLSALRSNSKDLQQNYLYSFLKYNQDMIVGKGGLAFDAITRGEILNIKIPIPPSEVQQQIVSEINIFEEQEQQKKSRIEELRAETETIITGFTEPTLISKICQLRSEKAEPQNEKDKDSNYIGLEHLQSNTGRLIEKAVVKGIMLKSTKNVFKKGDVLYGKLRPYLNKVYIAEFDGVCSTDILVLRTDQPTLLKYLLLSNMFVERSSALMKGINLPRLQVKEFLNFKIGYPSVSEQKKVAKRFEEIENEIITIEKWLSQSQPEKEKILQKHL